MIDSVRDYNQVQLAEIEAELHVKLDAAIKGDIDAKQASAGEVPEWAFNMLPKFVGAESVRHRGSLDAYTTLRTAFARYIAAREPAPVDPLLDALEELCLAEQCITAVDWAERAAAFLRQRGVTAPEGGAA